MKTHFCNFIFLIISQFAFSQTYSSYFTGDTSDVQTSTQFGICLMGGASENDDAMKWFLTRAGGGDIVVLRVTGADGYNNYLFTDLGISVNSVETIKIPSRLAALSPYVKKQLRNAEAVFIAGGNQADYLSFWKNTAVDSALNFLISSKKVPIGGLSAGMAIAGDFYFSASNGSIISSTALSDPYHPTLTLGNSDFINQPILDNTICDTHFDNPDRKGRLLTFMARMQQNLSVKAKAIACDEYTAVCIDSTGIAKVFGSSLEDDFAYFLQTNCLINNLPEICEAGLPLTWSNGQNAVDVYKIKGNETGSNQFNVKTWLTGNGGNWQKWFAQNGIFSENNVSNSPNCTTTSLINSQFNEVKIFINPILNTLVISANGEFEVIISDILGKIVFKKSGNDLTEINTALFPKGIYLVHLRGNQSITKKIVIE